MHLNLVLQAAHPTVCPVHGPTVLLSVISENATLASSKTPALQTTSAEVWSSVQCLESFPAFMIRSEELKSPMILYGIISCVYVHVVCI